MFLHELGRRTDWDVNYKRRERRAYFLSGDEYRRKMQSSQRCKHGKESADTNGQSDVTLVKQDAVDVSRIPFDRAKMRMSRVSLCWQCTQRLIWKKAKKALILFSS